MAVPALRQPKLVIHQKLKKLESVDENVIITLKGNKNLVISSDAYHGLIKGREMIRCVFCKRDMEPDVKLKDLHKVSDKHRVVVESYPHMEEFAENLIRKLDKDLFYCTLCNVIVASPFLTRHITSEVHSQELGKAEIKALAYKPSN